LSYPCTHPYVNPHRRGRACGSPIAGTASCNSIPRTALSSQLTAYSPSYQLLSGEYTTETFWIQSDRLTCLPGLHLRNHARHRCDISPSRSPQSFEQNIRRRPPFASFLFPSPRGVLKDIKYVETCIGGRGEGAPRKRMLCGVRTVCTMQMDTQVSKYACLRPVLRNGGGSLPVVALPHPVGAAENNGLVQDRH